jgi:hypothetical protein
VKSHSNLILADQFTAKIVGKREDHKEDADIKFKNLTLNVALDFIFHRNTIAVSPSLFMDYLYVHSSLYQGAGI